MASAPVLGAAVSPFFVGWVGTAQSCWQGQGKAGPCRVTLCSDLVTKGLLCARVKWEEEKRGSKGGRLEIGEEAVKW